MVVLLVALFCFCVFHIDQLLNRGALPLSPGFVIISRTGWKISNTTSLRPGSLLFKIWDVLFSLLLNEMASWFNLGMHWFLPKPNRVIAAGKHTQLVVSLWLQSFALPVHTSSATVMLMSWECIWRNRCRMMSNYFAVSNMIEFSI